MKILFFANTDWYLYNFRLALANAVREQGYEVVMLSPPGPYVERLESSGFRWVQAPMSRSGLNPLSELLFLLWLYRFLRDEQFQIIHNFTIKCSIYGSLAARAGGCCFRVNAVAGLGYVFTNRSLRARLLKPFVKLLARLAFGGDDARLIVQNPEDAQLFEDARIVKRDKIHLIESSGVNLSVFSERAEFVPGATLRVVLAARLLWDKGVGEFAGAAKLMKVSGYKVEFLLAGEPDPGNPDSVPEAMVRAWHDAGCVTWLGHVDKMEDLLSTVHVMVLPTVYGEGLPRSLIEGAACGLALITTDSPGCREVVSDDVEGFLIRSGDSDALVSAVRRYYDNPKLLRRHGDAAKSKALRKFDERLVISKTLLVYQSASRDK